MENSIYTEAKIPRVRGAALRTVLLSLPALTQVILILSSMLVVNIASVIVVIGIRIHFEEKLVQERKLLCMLQNIHDSSNLDSNVIVRKPVKGMHTGGNTWDYTQWQCHSQSCAPSTFLVLSLLSST